MCVYTSSAHESELAWRRGISDYEYYQHIQNYTVNKGNAYKSL